ncbi:MAG: hypothetical protein WDN72_08920 [Alphaproteobacteria bacterium]
MALAVPTPAGYFDGHQVPFFAAPPRGVKVESHPGATAVNLVTGMARSAIGGDTDAIDFYSVQIDKAFWRHMPGMIGGMTQYEQELDDLMPADQGAPGMEQAETSTAGASWRPVAERRTASAARRTSAAVNIQITRRDDDGGRLNHLAHISRRRPRRTRRENMRPRRRRRRAPVSAPTVVAGLVPAKAAKHSAGVGLGIAQNVSEIKRFALLAATAPRRPRTVGV